MTPRTYGALWIAFAALAGVVWLAGLMTPLAVVTFGFTAFGLVFTGMMCVLPGTVSHPQAPRPEVPKQAKMVESARNEAAPAHAYTYKSA